MITQDRKEEIFENFKIEAENFFVTKLITGEKLKEEYINCIDILYGISGTVDNNRGIIAFNKDYGQGKSFFFEVVNHANRRIKGKNLFVKTTAKEICDHYLNCPKKEDPIKWLNKFIYVKNLFIDDIGEELKDGQYRIIYGNKLNVIRYVLLRRYELWIEKGWKLFGTTNLSIYDIAQNYDGRVSDRLQEMTYWREFKFISNGTFRQMKQTRRLTQQEIKENWKKFLPNRKEDEKVDLVKYFNELINEPDEYFKDKDNSFWSFTKDFLIDNNYLTTEDFNVINESSLEGSEMLLKSEVRRSTKKRMKHAGYTVVSNAINNAISEITQKDIWNNAENIIAKQKFMELREQKHVFI